MGICTSCDVASFTLVAPEVVVVGVQWALIGTGPKGEGACWPSIVGEGALGEGGAYTNSSSWNPSHSV